MHRDQGKEKIYRVPCLSGRCRQLSLSGREDGICWGGGGGLNPQGLILAWSQNLHSLPRLSFIGNIMSLNSLVSASKP